MTKTSSDIDVTSLTHLFTEVFTPIDHVICVRCIDEFASFYDFVIVPTEWYFLFFIFIQIT